MHPVSIAKICRSQTKTAFLILIKHKTIFLEYEKKYHQNINYEYGLMIIISIDEQRMNDIVDAEN